MSLNDLAPAEIIVHLDRPRKFCYRFAAWRHLEAKFGSQKDVLAAMAALARGEGMVLDNLLTFLWAGLLRDDPTLTIPQVEELLEISQVPEYIAAVSSAIQAAFPPADTTRPR